ncbi:GtrA family protein [Cryobacterium arcticum]|uniref:GtrA family protein n=1 Tax=Cryobacterium arcticum TaxID=670052 RepID=UPI00142FBC80|nr:GtrA family protein [Cryobacterium arcticum]
MTEFLIKVWNRLARYALKFGVVGGAGFLVNVGIFNLLRSGVLGGGDFVQGPLGASMIAAAISILFNWVGNRFWTFREHRRQDLGLELLEYAAVSVAGMFFQIACLYVSHYVLGFTSLLADNISGNFMGIGLGTVFRFVVFRYWVYGSHRKGAGIAQQRTVELAPVPVEASQRGQ